MQIPTVSTAGEQLKLLSQLECRNQLSAQLVNSFNCYHSLNADTNCQHSWWTVSTVITAGMQTPTVSTAGGKLQLLSQLGYRPQL
jgi:hypothetical protein